MTFETSVIRDINVDRYMSSDISRHDIHSDYIYVSRHKRKCCQTDLHVISNLTIEMSQRSWKYLDIYQTEFPVMC